MDKKSNNYIYKEKEKVYYVKKDIIKKAKIIKIHYDDPDELYFTIKLKNNNNHTIQTVYKYLRPKNFYKNK